MAWAEKTWTPVSVHEIVAAFLQAERGQLTIKRYWKRDDPALYAQDMGWIDKPDVKNAAENHRRLRLLNLIRAPLLGEIPPDTVWYKVSNLQVEDLKSLHVIARCSWDKEGANDDNALLAVAQRASQELRTPPADWPEIILWGHKKEGPFTIIEGNHRLISYASTPDAPLDIPVFIGLSDTPFYFHIFDPPKFINNDLWQRKRRGLFGLFQW